MAKIGVVGYGFVGRAVGEGFESMGDDVLWYDKYKDSSSLEEVVSASEYVFLCLPTPFRDEEIDLRIIDENLELISKMESVENKIFIIKSTVVPGTTEKFAKKYPDLNLCVNPEFLREKRFLEDFMNPDRTVLGVDDEEIGKRMQQFYEERFPDVPLYVSDSKTAEMVKYMANSFLAVKVLFANEMFDLCENLGVDYEAVRKGVVADSRIGHSHLGVTAERGFGGKCFPKDLIALMGLFKERGVDYSLLKTVWKKNLEIRDVHDWEEIPFVKAED